MCTVVPLLYLLVLETLSLSLNSFSVKHIVTSLKHKWMAGLNMVASGKQSSPALRQPKNAVVIAKDSIEPSFLSVSNGIICSKMAKVIGNFLDGGSESVTAPLSAISIVGVCGKGMQSFIIFKFLTAER